jgi:hypothetical protein
VAADVRDLPGAGDLTRRLGHAAGAADAAAQKLEDGVAGLDEFINSIGGSSGAALPVGTVSEVGALLDTAQNVIEGLRVPTPALPGPLGLPVPGL